MPYSEAERGIFRYFNGVAEVCGDPLAIELALRESCDGKLYETLKLYNDALPKEGQPDTNAWVPYLRKLIDAGRAAFGIAFDPQTGKGDGQVVQRALWGFLEYLEKNAETAGSLPTGSRPSTSIPSSEPSLTPNTSR